MYMEFLEIAKFRPYERSPLYRVFYELLSDLSEEMENVSREVRKNDELWEY